MASISLYHPYACDQYHFEPRVERDQRYPGHGLTHEVKSLTTRLTPIYNRIDRGTNRGAYNQLGLILRSSVEKPGCSPLVFGFGIELVMYSSMKSEQRA